MDTKPTFDELLEGAKIEVARGRGAENCTFIIAAKRGAYPRSCRRCGLGPCAFTDYLLAARAPELSQSPSLNCERVSGEGGK